MIGFPLALILVNFAEWTIHKYVLHGLGKKRGSFWSFHWREHHSHSRRNGFVDEDYKNTIFSKWDAQSKEAALLLAAAVVHIPVFIFFPWYALGVWYSLFNYYYVHRKAHLNPEWAKKNLPWHYWHHMGKNQDCNWNVTKPWTDKIMGTYKPM